MKHIVMFSGGMGSYCAAKRVIERHGKGGVLLVFADTKMEDEDLYRFLGDAEKKLGVPLVRLCEGRTPWEVFRDERFLGNSRIDPCSKILKRQTLSRWLKENHEPTDCVLHVGIDWSEEHRFARMKDRNPPWVYEALMCQEPYLTKAQMRAVLEVDGVQIPRLYAMGFAHNNCGGFCIKAGQAAFRNLLEKMPERYAFHEEQEEALRVFLDKDVSILKDRSGGGNRRLTLKEFRERQDYDKFDFGGCGCFSG